MDEKVVLGWFQKYPKLETFIGAGNISLKMARTILEVDRYFMYDMYLDLVTAGAIRPSGANAFRASTELQAFLAQRRQEEK